jgi:diaminopimelate decarboxylase
MELRASQPPISLAAALDLATSHGTPLYVYSEERLRETIQHIQACFDYIPTEFFFAAVTNGNLALLRRFRDWGWGIHANTPGDVFLALQAGFSPANVVYSGSNLNRQEIEQLLAWRVGVLNLDCLDQLRLLCDLVRSQAAPHLSLGLRLNHPDLTGESRIGVSADEFPLAVALSSQVGLKISGLHFYRGTGTNATAAFTNVIGHLLAIARQLPDWSYLDLGGGFGYPYRHAAAAFDWQAFGRALGETLRQQQASIRLLLEPGRAAIAGCAVLLTTVVAIKWQGDRQIVGVDTSIANLAVLAVHGGYRQVVCASQTEGSATILSDVCGNTTYSRDYLARGCLLPRLRCGDLLMILDVGAYGYAMSSHFLHRPRPAEILLQDGHAHVIRERESLADLLHRQMSFN